jgi:hypothetical protein
MVQRDDPECSNPQEGFFNPGLNGRYGQEDGDDLNYHTIGLIPDFEITLQDLLSSSSLDSVTHKKKVKSLAIGLGSLSAVGILGVTQTFNGKKDFESNDWKMVASQAKMMGADLGLVGDSGNPLAIFTKDGDPYVWSDSTSGPNQWFNVDLGETKKMVPLGVEDQKEITAQAALMQGIASAANVPVRGFSGFHTTKTPYTSSPTLEMRADGSFSLKPGQKLTVSKIPIPGTQFSIVAAQPINVYSF